MFFFFKGKTQEVRQILLSKSSRKKGEEGTDL